MLNVNTIYMSKEVVSFVDDIISSYNIKNYYDVSFCDKKTLSSLLVKCEIYTVCFDFLEAFLKRSFSEKLSKFLNTTNFDNGVNLLSDMSICVVSHYENIMEEIFLERIDYAETSKKKQRYFD